MPIIINALNFHRPAPDVLAQQISDPGLRDRAMAMLATTRPEALDFIQSQDIQRRAREYIEWESQLPSPSDPFAPPPEYPGPLPWSSSEP